MLVVQQAELYAVAENFLALKKEPNLEPCGTVVTGGLAPVPLTRGSPEGLRLCRSWGVTGGLAPVPFTGETGVAREPVEGGFTALQTAVELQNPRFSQKFREKRTRS